MNLIREVHSSAATDFNEKCKQKGLGSPLQTHGNTRKMNTIRGIPQHQLAQTVSGATDPSCLPITVIKAICPHVHRQHDGKCTHKPTGEYKVNVSVPRDISLATAGRETPCQAKRKPEEPG